MYMKRTFIIAAIAIASASIASAQEKVDSVVVENPRRVVVVSDATSQSVSIKGSADDSGYTYYRKVEVGKSGDVYESERFGLFDFNVPFAKKPKTAKAKFNAGLFNIYGGFMVNSKPVEPYGFDSWISDDWGFSLFRYKSRPIGKCLHITSALGFGFKNFTSSENVMYNKVDGGITVAPVPADIKLKSSVVKLYYMTVPFMLEFYSKNDRFGFSLGPVINLNYHSRIKNVYTVNGQVAKDKVKNIHAKPVTVDYMGLIRFTELGLFVKWAPHGHFDAAYSQDIQTVTVGVIMNFNW